MVKRSEKYKRRRSKRNMPEKEKEAYVKEHIKKILDDDSKYIFGCSDLRDAITYLYGDVIHRFEPTCEVSSNYVSGTVAPAFMKHDKIKHNPSEPIKVLKASLCNPGTALPLLGISNPDATMQIKSIDVPTRTKTRDMKKNGILAFDVNLGRKWSEVDSANQYVEEKQKRDNKKPTRPANVPSHKS